MSEVSLSPEYLNTIKALCEQIEFENRIYSNFHRSELGAIEIPQITEEDYDNYSNIPEVQSGLSDIAAVEKCAKKVIARNL